MAADGKKEEHLDMDAILKMARKKPMNVAMVIGKDGLAMAGDPRKGLEAMWRAAKAAAGGGSKGGMGVCNVVGKEIQIQFAGDDYPATLKKAFKDSLRNLGLKFKPVFIGADGTVDGDDDDDEAGEGDGSAPAVAAAGTEAGTTENPEDDMKAALLAEFDGFRNQLSAAKTASPLPAIKKLEALEQMFQIEIERAPKKAMAVLSLMRKTAEAFAPAAGAPDPAADRAADERHQSLASLEKSVDALLAEFA